MFNKVIGLLGKQCLKSKWGGLCPFIPTSGFKMDLFLMTGLVLVLGSRDEGHSFLRYLLSGLGLQSCPCLWVWGWVIKGKRVELGSPKTKSYGWRPFPTWSF